MLAFATSFLVDWTDRRLKRTATRTAHGQSLVEFALVLPVLMLLTLGVIDMGRAFTFGVGVQQGAREAARYGSRLAVNTNVSDSTVVQRLIDASNPALQGCSAVLNTLQTCGGGNWTFTLQVTPPGSVTTYSSIATAISNSAANKYLSGGKITVVADGSVALMSGVCTGGGLCLPTIGVHGQTSMEFL